MTVVNSIGQLKDTQTSNNYRWFILVVAWLALQLGFVDRLIWANVSVVVGQSLALPLAALGVFVTAFYVGYVIANAVGGFASDVVKSRWIIFCALAPLGIGTFFFGGTTSLTYGLICQLLMGLGAGINYSACVKLVMMWFEKTERGRAMGILTTATSLGVVIDNAVVPKLMQEIGWQGVYHVFGVITFAVAIFVLLVLNKQPPLQTLANQSTVKEPISALLKNKNLMWLSIAGFCAMWGTWGFTFWANALMVKGYQISSIEAGSVVFLFGIGAVISKPVIGWVSDILGGRCKPLLMIVFFGFALMLFLYAQLNTLMMFRLVAPILGIFAFSYTPLMAALVGETVGVARTGAATGVTNAIWQLGSLLAPSVVGIVYQNTESFFIAVITLAIGPLLAAILMLKVKER